MDVILKGVGGGLMMALIVLASKRGSVLPGILPLMPTFAVIALLSVGANGDAAGFKTASLAGIKTIPAYLVFLIVCYWLGDVMDYRLAVICGFAAWLAVVLVMFFAPRFL